MNKKGNILIIVHNAVGHVNACIGIGQALRDRGHKIVFAIAESFKGELERYGFDEEILVKAGNDLKYQKPGECEAHRFLSAGLISGKTSLEKILIIRNSLKYGEFAQKTLKNEPTLKAIIDKHKPDVIIIDYFVTPPQILFSDIPWVLSVSANPLYIMNDERTPPAWSGYASCRDKTNWNEFREIFNDWCRKPLDIYNKWLTENGYPEIEGNLPVPESPHLNIYQYPEELDYTDIRPKPEKWFRIDALMREVEEEFELPEKLRQNTDPNSKLIYLSMGSMGSIDVSLMNRLVAMLSKSKHRFIVSKGLNHKQYELTDNMWGQRSVPQTKVLPLVDLVITHGGNNTVTETFSFGKPMIVMPLFNDQYDNAQRIEEKGYGIRLDPYNCSENDLLESIDKLLNDNILKAKLLKASERISASNTKTKAAELIENLFALKSHK